MSLYNIRLPSLKDKLLEEEKEVEKARKGAEKEEEKEEEKVKLLKGRRSKKIK